MAHNLTLPGRLLQFKTLLLVKAFLALVFIHQSAIAQYRFDHWTAETGLPQNMARDLIQTRDGYLWITTQGGLARFDGQRLTVFNKVTQPEILSNRFTFLHEDRMGNLWIGSEQGGVLRYRDGAFTSWTAKDGLPGNYVDHIDEDETGTILIFTDQGAAQWRDGKFAKLPLASQSVPLPGSIPLLGGFGRYLSFALRPAETGYRLFNRGRWEDLPNPPGLPAGFALPIDTRNPPLREDTRGRLWFHWRNISGYYERREERWEVTIAPPTLGIPFYLDQKGRYWTIYNSSVTLEKDGKATPLPVQGVTWAYRVLEDREGNFWLGTYDNGLFRLIEQAVHSLPLQGRPNERYVYSLLEDRSGAVWISAGVAGLTRYANGRLTRFSLLGGRRPWDISSFYEDRDGSLLVGTYLNGLTRLSNGQWRIDPELSEKVKGRVDVIYRDRQGDLWFGGQNGLDRQSADGRWTHYGPDNGLPTRHVKTMLEDSAGGLWIGGYGCLALWRDGGFIAWAKGEGLSEERVISLYEDSERVLWVGTSDSGIYRLRPEGASSSAAWGLTRYTTREGLHSNEVKQILEDERGYFWIGSGQGIYRLRKQELNDFAEGRGRFITSTSFGKADGMLSVDCAGGFQPAGFKARDGRLWFPTQDGVAIVDPRQVLTKSLPPPVALEECRLDGRAVDWRQNVQINPGQSSLEISYTGLSFDKAEQMRFRYRLEGLDADWIEAGARRTAYYSHIPPGSYTFRVIAANSDGVWNRQGQSLQIIVAPPFHRTWWFLGITMLTVVGAALAAYRYRSAQLRRERDAQQRFARQLIESQELERKRIAAELHDGLGQKLILMRNWAAMGLMRSDPAAKAREQLSDISTAAAQSLNEVREIIYNLRPSQLEAVGLSETIRYMLSQLASASRIEWMIEVAPLDGLFDPEQEVIFFRIVQECANNIVKHSQATEATTLIEREGNMVHLTIEDNGRGFNPAAINGAGFGLRGLQERVRMLNGRFSLESTPGRGVKILITIE